MTTPDLSFLPATIDGRDFVGWDGFSYVDGAGLTVWSGVTEPSAADLADAFASPRPVPSPDVPSVLTPLTVLSRLTDAERLGIFTSEDPGVIVFRNMAVAAAVIRSDDDRTLDGFAYLVSAGLLTQSRVVQILAL